MADILTSQLLQPSFGGVTFSVRSVQSESGRKIVLHELLNSDERFAEDLGEIPPTFDMDAFVHGVDFKERANSLETILRQVGAHKLVTPEFGEHDVYSLGYTKRASQTAVGEIKFSLKFATGRVEASPVVGTTDKKEVFSAGDNARQEIQEAFIGLWKIPKNVANISIAQSDLLDTAQVAFSSFSDIVPSENLQNMQRNLSIFQDAAGELVRNPSALANNLIGGTPVVTGLWQEISLGLSDGTGLPNLLKLSDFGSVILKDNDVLRGAYIRPGDNVPLWDETTAGRIQRNINRLALVNVNRIASLVTSYEVASAGIYQTSDEINTVRAQIEQNHETLMRIDTIDRNLLQSNDKVRDSVENVRIAALKVLEGKEQQAFKVDNIEIQRASSSFVQAYALYADELKNQDELEERTLSLRSLNPSLPAIAFVQNTKVFKVRENV